MTFANLKTNITLALIAVAATSMTSLGARAQAPKNGGSVPDQRFPASFRAPEEVPGEVMVRLANGMNGSTFAQAHGLTVKRKLQFAPNTYVFRGVAGDPDVAAAQLRKEAGVLVASSNEYLQPAALPIVEPNDPLAPEQWAMRAMNVPTAWGISVGERFVNGPRRNVVVGLIDLAPSLFHPDLFDVIDSNGFDFVNDVPLSQSPIGFFGSSHGTQVAGAIAAVPGNGEGIASIPFEGVSLLPCVAGSVETFGNITQATLVASNVTDAIYFCMQQDVDIINMSFTLPGSGFFVTPFDPFIAQACEDANSQGIVLVAASGNNPNPLLGTTVGFPAYLPECIAVGAVGPSGEAAYYSQGGVQLDVVAPGGNDATNVTFQNRVLVTDFFGYDYAQGTSIAAGYVSGQIAMLMTQGAIDETLTPVEQVFQARNLVEGTARTPFGGFSTQLGAGVVDVGASLKAATHYIDVTSPAPNEITASFAEPVEFRIIQPVPYTLEDGEFDIFNNGTSVVDEAQIISPQTGRVRYEPTPQTRYNIGSNSINITAESEIFPNDGTRSLAGPAEGNIPERIYLFRVRPRINYPGLQTLSVPYELQGNADDLQFLFGGNLIRLARWLPLQNRYAVFDATTSPQDPEASLTTSDSGVTRPPIGTGFWARVTDVTQVQLLGRSERSGLYRIPLKQGWNLVGNPYPFRVPFSAASVEFGNEIMSITVAAQRNLLKGVIWRFVDGTYKYSVLPNGQFVDWEAHWVYSNTNITLIVPRVVSNIAAASAAPSGVKVASNKAPRSAAGDGWATTLRARAAGASAGELVIGRRAGKTLATDLLAMPPSPLRTADLRLAGEKSAKGVTGYAQDIRGSKDSTRSWTVRLETSEPGVPVKLSWDRVPVDRKLYLQPAGATQPKLMTPNGVFSFRAARPGVHLFTIREEAARGA